MVINALNLVLKKIGYKIVQDDFDNKYSEFLEIYNFCKPYTMTSVERMYALYKGVEYVIKNNIPGDFIECGVWKGGSSMLIAKTLLKFNINNRKIWMYDTYEGMVEPGENDKDTSGQNAHGTWVSLKNESNKSGWCVSSLEEVKGYMNTTNYPTELIHFIEGKVEETIPTNIPNGQIALLRLDTDWYESTRHELIHLFPLLIQKGIFIIDDYGHWVGAKKALDEYLSENNIQMFLNYIDYTARIAVKV